MTQLCKAVSEQNIAKIKSLLESAKDSVNTPDTQTHKTPLQIATAANNLPVVNLLLEGGAIPDLSTVAGDKIVSSSPLSIAVQNGATDIVIRLFEEGANPDTRDADGYSPIHLAVKANKLHLIKILVKYGTDIDAPKAGGPEFPALFIAIGSENQDAVNELFDNKASLDPLAATGGPTALHIAANRGDSDIFDMVMRKTKELTDTKTGTAFDEAARVGHLDVMKKLQKHFKIDLSKQSYALHLAIQEKHEDITYYLLASNASSSEPDQFTGGTDLLAAVSAKNMELVEKFESQVNIPNSKTSVTPLLHAIESHASNIAQFLMNHGAELLAVDQYGQNALMYAIHHKEFYTAKLLTSRPEVQNNIMHRNNNGFTAEDIAKELGNPTMIGYVTKAMESYNELQAADRPSTDAELPVPTHEIHDIDSQKDLNSGFAVAEDQEVVGTNTTPEDEL